MEDLHQPGPERGATLVVMYHYVRDPEQTPFPALKTLRVPEWEAQLNWLASTGPVTSYDAFDTHGRGATPAGVPDRPALLTFDDGFVDHYTTVYPSLRARGWTGVFFVAGAPLDDPPRLLNVHKTQFLLAALGAVRFAEVVEEAASVPGEQAAVRRPEVYRYDEAPDVAAKHRLNYEMPRAEATRLLSALFTRHIGDEAAFARGLYLSRDMIREMAAAGMTFGFHTEDHPVLSRLDRAAQHRELARGVALVRALTGQARVPFCYPYGHAHTYNGDTLAVLEETGYSMAFTTTRRLARPGVDARFELPRVDTRDLPPFVPQPRL